MNKSKKDKKETKCLFETEHQMPTCNKYDKEACSMKTIDRGLCHCVYIWPRERAKEFLELEVVNKEKIYES